MSNHLAREIFHTHRQPVQPARLPQRLAADKTVRLWALMAVQSGHQALGEAVQQAVQEGEVAHEGRRQPGPNPGSG